MPDDLPPLSSYQRFTTERLARADLRAASYNPRRDLTDGEKRKLRTLLKKHGLFNALVFNKRTGNLVAGHQRLKLLDALHEGKPYSLDVNVVDVDERQEREMNIAHNNQEAAADFDIEKLGALLKDTELKLDIDATGFDAADVFAMFGGDAFDTRAEELTEVAEQVRKFSEEVNSGHTRAVSKHSTDFYTVLVWKDEAAKDAGHAALGLTEDRFQDGRTILQKLKLASED
ncbi:MAG TPA: ParB/RepB/Spo0J family partition protein [Gemmata sp.]